MYNLGMAKTPGKRHALPMAEVRAGLPSEVKKLRSGRPLLLERRGRPVAALVSVEDAQRIEAEQRGHSRDATVVMAFNHAGGAGKTSTIRDLGYELTELGYRVLLIDLDPQANLTVFLGIEDAPPERSLRDVLEDYAPLPEPYLRHGMDLIASHLQLTRTERRLPGFTNADGRLRVALERLKAEGRYDFILLDPPPSLGVLTANAAASADYVVVPVPAVFKGMVALDGMEEMLREYTLTNPRLRVAFYLVTRVDTTSHSREVVAAYERNLGGLLAGPITYRPAVYNKCQPMGEPVGVTDPSGPARAEVQHVTQRLLDVVGKQVPR